MGKKEKKNLKNIIRDIKKKITRPLYKGEKQMIEEMLREPKYE